MAAPLHILLLEDQPDDAELILLALRRAGFEFETRYAATEAEYLLQLSACPDLILADYYLPQFDALRALQLLQERGADIPFIIITGALAEETMVACMQRGADDYLLKDRLARLGPAVTRVLRAKQLRADKQQAAAEIAALYRASAPLLHTGDLASVARQVARAVTQEFASVDCGVMLLDDSGTELKRIARAGTYQVQAMAPLLVDGSGLTVAAYRTGQTIYAPDVTADPRYMNNDDRTRSEVAVPLQIGERVIGVLDLQSPELDAFGERTRRIVTAYAKNAALALENAQLVARLESARQTAETANRLKSEFLANTSHELRTPLTGILGALSIIQDNLCNSPEEERQFVEVAHDAARHLMDIINTVLDLAKIEAGKISVEFQAVDAGVLIAEAYTRTHQQAEEKKVRLAVLPLPAATPPVWADPDKLRQILLNLIDNAIKFTEQGQITITAQTNLAAGCLQIMVRDTGIGIPQDAQDKLFQPFVQVDGSTTRKYGGTGLGLCLSRKLAELMHGTLTLYSSGAGRGCTLTLTLPLAAKISETAAAGPPR